ncbi:MAG: phosphocholine cytidylyltransferase family protein [Acidobacteria bacterium]|nr:phosphocholine cytidylyltransferase family protein [Acidobacteriota bacterium]
MKGIVLAAGKGLRLNGATGNTPKCLMEIGGGTLLERQIHTLRNCGITDIVVVVGYQAERVRQSCDGRIRFVENSRFDQTNSLYSLWLARQALAEGFVVLNSDVLFHPQLLANLLAAPYHDALLIDYGNPLSTALGDEEMKVKVRGERVIEISKTMPPQEADGENLGIVKFNANSAALLIEIMQRLITNGGQRDWAPRAFCEFAAARPLYAVDAQGYPWIEIDFPEDFQRAVRDILPKLPAADSRTTAPRPLSRQAQAAEFFS